MNRKEVFILFADNPNSRVILTKGVDGKVIKDKDYIFKLKDGIIYSIIDESPLYLYVKNDKAEFEIIKNLREMCYGEAIWHYNNDESVNLEHITSVISSRSLARVGPAACSKEEIMGKWTVEGVYEGE